MPEDNIDMARVPQWQNLFLAATARRRTDRVELTGWRLEGSQMASFTQYNSSLDNLVRRATFDGGLSDLQDVHGFANSKSDLVTFRSTDEMVKTNSADLIRDVSIDGLHKNLAHEEISLLRERPTDWLQVHQWDGRMFLVNDGGSHHLAAAKYIAGRIGVTVVLRVPLHYYSIHPSAVALLRRDYDIYLVSDKPELTNAFFDAMQSFGATWLWHELPQPYEHAKAIFLPRAEAPSMRVSQVFRDAGFVDLGQHLEDVALTETPRVVMRRALSPAQPVIEASDDDEAASSAPRA